MTQRITRVAYEREEEEVMMMTLVIKMKKLMRVESVKKDRGEVSLLGHEKEEQEALKVV